jgi:pseudaminic acid synthase
MILELILNFLKNIKNKSMLKIGKRIISKSFPPFIIAEISGNHNGKIENVLKMIDLASRNNIDAIKLQTYTADTMTIKSNRKEFFISDKKNLWKNESLYNLYKKAHTPWEWHKKIFNYAKRKNIICFSSPFDETAVDFLEDLNVPAYKVASFENDHFPLLEKIASTGKPVIISTGLTDLNDIKKIVKIFKLRKTNIALLKCTSNYPADPAKLNLKTIPDMRKKFNVEIGFSDHTTEIGSSLAAISLGATIIEKHFTLKKNFGIDGKFSSTIEDLRKIKVQSKIIWKSLGKINYDGKKTDKLSLKFKRSIYTCEDIQKGEKFTKENLRIIRPRKGILPIYFKDLINKKSPQNLNKGMPLNKDLLKKLKIK